MNWKSYLLKPGAALLLLSLAAACGSDGTTPPPGTPTVMSNTPLNGATGVALNGIVSATFSVAMDPATLTTTTFTLTSGAAAVPVPGTVTYANATAVFRQAAQLASNSSFTATITTGAKSAAGVALAANRSWSFTTGTTVVTGGPPVNLGTAGNYVILAKSGISTVPTSAVTGNLGVSPAAATSITGFSLILDASGTFSTSSQVTGRVHAADYTPPTPANLTTAVSDMQLAFTDAAGRAPGVTELGAGNIGGMTLASGVYKWGTGLLIPTDVTLTGSATDVWIFQIAQNLTMSSAARILLAGGALPKNVFWQVSGAVDLGTTAHFEGVILSQTAIALRTGASINGRLLAQTAVTIDGSTVVQPAP
jgi:ice-binding like protein/Big-like domain-containing protein